MRDSSSEVLRGRVEMYGMEICFPRDPSDDVISFIIIQIIFDDFNDRQLIEIFSKDLRVFNFFFNTIFHIKV